MVMLGNEVYQKMYQPNPTVVNGFVLCNGWCCMEAAGDARDDIQNRILTPNGESV
jgi:hypothetical protein